MVKPTAENSERRRRVLFVVQSVEVGGMEAYCLELSREFVSRGLSVSVLLPQDLKFDNTADGFCNAGARVRRLALDSRLGRRNQLLELWRYFRLLKTFGPDVVHIHTGGATGGVAPAVIARLLSRAAVVSTEHDVPALHSRLLPRLTRRLLDHSVHILVACSRKNGALRRERLGVWTNDKRFVAVPIGIACRQTAESVRAETGASLRAELGIAQDDVVIGCVVRFVPGKGLEDLIAAFQILTLGQGRLHLLLVGDGPLRPLLEGLANRVQDDRTVHFLGFQANPRRFVHCMDIFALAVHEGTGSLALMEAMSEGVPSVITFGGPEEAVIDGQTGYCAAPNDPAHLASKLQLLASSPELRARLGREGERHIRRNFTMARVAEDLLEVYAGARTARLPGRHLVNSSPDVTSRR